MKFKSISIIAVILIGLMAASFTYKANQAKKPWLVPDAAKNKKNAVASNAKSIADGKVLWNTHCKSCHGAKGLGDGTTAAQLKTEPGNFSKAEAQAESDGAFFYKISEGRDDMPSFKKKIPDTDDIWNLVNFMRTLKK